MADTMTRTFSFKRDENAASSHSATVTVPGTIGELPKAIQAALYQDALRNITIKVQGSMRRWIRSNETASTKQISAQAQAYFDEALKGERRASVTVVVEQLKATIDATAMGLSKAQIAHFAADENVELINVPEKHKDALVEKQDA